MWTDWRTDRHGQPIRCSLTLEREEYLIIGWYGYFTSFFHNCGAKLGVPMMIINSETKIWKNILSQDISSLGILEVSSFLRGTSSFEFTEYAVGCNACATTLSFCSTIRYRSVSLATTCTSQTISRCRELMANLTEQSRERVCVRLDRRLRCETADHVTNCPPSTSSWKNLFDHYQKVKLKRTD